MVKNDWKLVSIKSAHENRVETFSNFELGDQPQVCYDMLGNATVPQAPQVQLHTQPQFDMLGNPIGDNPPQQQPQQPAPEPENKINGVSIVGVVNTENTEPEEKTGNFLQNSLIFTVWS